VRVMKSAALAHGLVPLSITEVTLFARFSIAREITKTPLRRHMTAGERY
jgi:hypothetical protein